MREIPSTGEVNSWEPSSHSADPFPHVYGPLNLDAVAAVIPLEPDDAGTFTWPPS